MMPVARSGAQLLRNLARRSANCSNRKPRPSSCCSRKPGTDIAANVAHCSPYLGVMLPYSPLHHLLMQECRLPLGRHQRQPQRRAHRHRQRRSRRRASKDIADHFLMHNRPIVRACDDSVVRLTRGRAGILRRARGYAPLGIRICAKPAAWCSRSAAHLKNTVAIGVGQDVFLSQHIGDLETLEARAAFENAIDDLCRLYSFKPEVVACDLHPDYASTHWAEKSGLPLDPRAASSGACRCLRGREQCARDPISESPGMAPDTASTAPSGAASSFAWRARNQFERIAHLRPFGLPGGDAAVREGWRSAASLIFEVGGLAPAIPDAADAISRENPDWIDAKIRYMLEHGINVVPTTSVGRLFDAVACITGVAQQNRFEGQAAMLLENEIGALAHRRGVSFTRWRLGSSDRGS